MTRRLRSRLRGAHATHGQIVAAQRNIKAAIALLDGLAALRLTLATASQGDLEAWLTTAQAGHRTDAGDFALFQLATELPAAVLARMVGIHITVAVACQRASAGDWTTYAAAVARRTSSAEH